MCECSCSPVLASEYAIKVSNFVDRSFRTCNPEEMYLCADVYSAQFIHDGLTDVLCSCPVQCQTTQYTYAYV